MKEIWVDIKDFEGLYMVSNYGRVKSLNYNRTGREEILKAGINRTGHLFVYLYKNGTKKPYSIHRLVAEAFIPNPEMKSDVHHIDHNPANNNVDNLIWLTHKEHMAEHPEIFEVASEASRKAGRDAQKKACSKHINQFTIDGLFLRAWYSSYDIQRELGYDNSHIIKCCKGGYFNKRRNKWVNMTQYKGSIWKYAEDC